MISVSGLLFKTKSIMMQGNMNVKFDNGKRLYLLL